jgi:hypothetical protein
MAVTIIEESDNGDERVVIATFSADNDATPWYYFNRGYITAHATSIRSGASAYPIAIQGDVQGDLTPNVAALTTVTEASPTSTLTAANCGRSLAFRMSATTVNSQTITVAIKWSR